MKIGKAIFLLFLLNTLLFSCKKGDEDPFISFRSRSSRLAGDWKVSIYKEKENTTYEYPTGKTVVCSFNRNFGQLGYKEVTSDTAGTFAELNGKVSRSEYHFSKDGSWNSTLEYYVTLPQPIGGYYISKKRIDEEGTWKFNSKSGDLKNKESIDLTTATSKIYYNTYSSYLGTVIDSIADSIIAYPNKIQTWKLIRLSNTNIKARIDYTNSFVSSVAGISGTKITTKNEVDIELGQ